jgi:drug/metabolite transporter (DMT)-like permease
MLLRPGDRGIRLTGLVAAILGFLSAVVYGASDFFGGLASRRMSALLVSFITFGVAVVAVGVGVLIERPLWSTDAVLLGAIAGVSGTIGQWAFFAALALGPMSIISPGVAAIYALIPAIVGIALGERLPPIGYVALVAVVIAAVMLAVTREPGNHRVTPRALLLGLIAGVGFGGYIVAIDATPAESGLVPLLVDLAVGIVLLGAVLMVRRLRSGPDEWAGLRDRRTLGLALAAGATLAAANIMLVIALHLGELSIVGVLNSLYPLGTVLLAMIVLRERLTWVQALGIALAISASAVLALVE